MIGLLLTVAATQAAPPAQDAAAVEAAARAADPDVAARTRGPREAHVTFAELDELLLWRNARTQAGQAALRQLLELAMLEELAREAELEVTPEMLSARWDELDAQFREGGFEEGLLGYVADQGVDPDTFREYLRLAIVHETLTRRALGLDPDARVTKEQQESWLEGELEERGYTPGEFPYEDGVVARCGDVVIDRDAFADHLRSQTPPEELRELCYLLLLEEVVKQRLPDLTAEGVEGAVDRELERRRAEAEADPTYQGLSYERLLEAKGLDVEAVRRDPAIRCAALAHHFVDRSTDEEALRVTYQDERAFFDGLFGEGVEVRALMLKAARRKNELVPRTFEEADALLVKLRRGAETEAAFAQLVLQYSEDPATRESGGQLGVVRRGAVNIPAPMREAIFEALDAREGDVSGTIVGPVRIQGGSVLVMLGERHPAPTWEVMRGHVHRELRRRFLDEALSRDDVVTWLDPGWTDAAARADDGEDD